MTEPQWLDVKDLRTKLENYKLIVFVNEELVNSNVSTRDELSVSASSRTGLYRPTKLSGG